MSGCDRPSWLLGLSGLIMFFATATASADSITGVSSLGALGANDQTTWSQLGPDSTTIPSPFTATSMGGVTVTGTFQTGSSGLVAVQGTSWTGGFPAGDSLVWTFDATKNTFGAGSGPLQLGFSSNVSAAGVEIQSDEPVQFTAKIEAFQGATSLGSFSQTSDTASDPVFIGLIDQTNANISSVVISLTSGPSDLGDFAIDTLFSRNPASTPEPATITLLGGISAIGMVGYAWRRRRELAKA